MLQFVLCCAYVQTLAVPDEAINIHKSLAVRVHLVSSRRTVSVFIFATGQDIINSICKECLHLLVSTLPRSQTYRARVSQDPKSRSVGMLWDPSRPHALFGHTGMTGGGVNE